jgi:hypothetical protein
VSFYNFPYTLAVILFLSSADGDIDDGGHNKGIGEVNSSGR